MKAIKLIAVLAALTTLSPGFTACGDDDEPDNPRGAKGTFELRVGLAPEMFDYVELTVYHGEGTKNLTADVVTKAEVLQAPEQYGSRWLTFKLTGTMPLTYSYGYALRIKPGVDLTDVKVPVKVLNKVSFSSDAYGAGEAWSATGNIASTVTGAQLADYVSRFNRANALYTYTAAVDAAGNLIVR